MGAPALDFSVALAELLLKRFMAHNGIVLDAISLPHSMKRLISRTGNPVLFFLENWDPLDASKDTDAGVSSESLNP